MTYYLWINEAQAGPYTMEQLKGMWLAGAITMETPYCAPGAKAWTQLGALVENQIQRDKLPTVAPETPAPAEKPWGRIEYGILLLLTILIPLIGFCIGLISVWKPAKRQQAGALIGVAFFIFIAYFLVRYSLG